MPNIINLSDERCPDCRYLLSSTGYCSTCGQTWTVKESTPNKLAKLGEKNKKIFPKEETIEKRYQWGERTREPEFYGNAEPWIICKKCNRKIKKYPCLWCQQKLTEKDTIVRKRYITEEVRRKVWRRDEGRCVDCGTKELLEFDHIIPVSRGGSNTVRNIQLLCEKCNRKKSNLI